MPADQFCRDGACVQSCYSVRCGYQQRCRDGACVPDPCHTLPAIGDKFAKMAPV